MDLGEIAAAKEFEYYICDVDKELKQAEKELIKLETIGYDISLIIDMQDSLYNKYNKKIKEIYK